MKRYKISKEVTTLQLLRDNAELWVVEVLLECVKDQLISLDAIDSILDKRFSRTLSDTIDEEDLKSFFKYELLDDEEFINKYPEVNKRFE